MTSSFKTKLNEAEKFNSNAPLFPISVIADILNVHQRTLRIYDDEGILVPSRSQKNRRLYSYQDIECGQLVQFLTRELGINLAGTKVILELLKQKKLAGDEARQYIKEIALNIDITSEQLKENKLKFQKRGRKPGK